MVISHDRRRESNSAEAVACTIVEFHAHSPNLNSFTVLGLALYSESCVPLSDAEIIVDSKAHACFRGRPSSFFRGILPGALAPTLPSSPCFKPGPPHPLLDSPLEEVHLILACIMFKRVRTRREFCMGTCGRSSSKTCPLSYKPASAARLVRTMRYTSSCSNASAHQPRSNLHHRPR
jgi:hypothetical protein